MNYPPTMYFDAQDNDVYGNNFFVTFTFASDSTAASVSVAWRII